MSLVYVIRHGQASFGTANYDALSPLGFRQAEILGNHCLDLGIHFDAVVSGTMNRQQQTARTFLDVYRQAGWQMPEPIVLPAFDEYDAFGIWDNHVAEMLRTDVSLAEMIQQAQTDRKAFQKLFEIVMMEWASGKRVLPGEPTWPSIIERVRDGVDTIMRISAGMKHVAVFTSGGPIGIWMKLALGLSDPKAMEISWQVLNASVSRFFIGKRGVFLSGFNDVCHLLMQKPPDLITYR
ncbi:histidine phosphatase family protein [Desulfatirhabdium butyrativorans]|uniref:histidine phosphatase family protein n=1 Tax=Desulfatirhabdium butyrativorans TaxID=340467 RepID=UPI00041A764A|nr:histidine phosphatase family protein [Desulfatirhabdium butyrativorans]